MQIIEGAAEVTASRTIEHLSGSPKPRTFQDKTEKFLELLNI